MPIYEYVCSECGHQHEALQKFSDAPLSVCPACARDTLKKKISAPAFRLRGTGWYETDFKSDKQKNLSQGDSAEKKSDAGTDKKSDGKAAKKADDKATKSGTKTGNGGKEAAA